MYRLTIAKDKIPCLVQVVPTDDVRKIPTPEKYCVMAMDIITYIVQAVPTADVKKIPTH
jgi:hypothetical protein